MGVVLAGVMLTLAGLAFKLAVARYRRRLRRTHPGLRADPELSARAEAFTDAVVLCALAFLVAVVTGVEAMGQVVVGGLLVALLLSYWLRFRAGAARGGGA
ncbi:MAG: hypothetical protein Q4G43_17035 [Mobilicoccus sp.]|nr:hypothetical protein [Mobilicoccus sp.]